MRRLAQRQSFFHYSQDLYLAFVASELDYSHFVRCDICPLPPSYPPVFHVRWIRRESRQGLPPQLPLAISFRFDGISVRESLG